MGDDDEETYKNHAVCTPEKHLCICEGYKCCECHKNKREPTEKELLIERFYEAVYKAKQSDDLMKEVINVVKMKEVTKVMEMKEVEGHTIQLDMSMIEVTGPKIWMKADTSSPRSTEHIRRILLKLLDEVDIEIKRRKEK